MLKTVINAYYVCGNIYSVVAGSGTLGYQNGDASSAEFQYPEGITILGSDIYVAGGADNCFQK